MPRCPGCAVQLRRWSLPSAGLVNEVLGAMTHSLTYLLPARTFNFFLSLLASFFFFFPTYKQVFSVRLETYNSIFR